MKFKLIYPLLFIFLIACNNSTDAPAIVDDSTTVAKESFTWQITTNDTNGKMMFKKMLTPRNSIDAATVLEPVMAMYPEIKPEYIGVSNDTAYLKIADANFLTRQMGSNGALEYLATLVYNITEIPHVSYVNLSFEPGDHAQPGVFSRADFNK